MTVQTLPKRRTTTSAVSSRETTDWRLLSACRDEDPELFFPTTAEDREKAKRVCAGCPVVLQCRDLAANFQAPSGVWGGIERVDTKRSYGASQMTAAQDVLLNRRAELDAAVGEGLTPAEIALRLRTNVQTISAALVALRAGDADWHLVAPNEAMVAAYLAGECPEVQPQDRLAAVVQGVREGLTFAHFDRMYGLRGHATAEFIRKARLVFKAADIEFPDMGRRVTHRLLKDADVVTMRELAAFRGVPVKELAAVYKVSRRTVQSVLSGLYYRDVAGPLRVPRSRPVRTKSLSSNRQAVGSQGMGAAA
ncbi:WhiB family transcriptional regulator [Streptomyces sp. NPDC047737]|uniref:WhiB family transcriptional regulator n=1 Tax=Streptomyces sp. NPDC047737 TaxID=3155740 RepID=UPI0033D1509A